MALADRRPGQEAAPPGARGPGTPTTPPRATELLGPTLANLVSIDRRHRYEPGPAAPPLHPRRARRAGPQGGAAVTGERITAASGLAADVLQRVSSVVIGKREALGLILGCILAGGHALLEDYPGLGKTLAARSFAQTLGLDVQPRPVHARSAPRRPDRIVRLRPARRGLHVPPGSAVHRAPARGRDQPHPPEDAGRAARGDAGATGHGRRPDVRAAAPFHVLATANPVEYEGTYPLPEAQLDRFLLRVSFGYPSADEEWDVLRRRIARQREELVLDRSPTPPGCSPCRPPSRRSPSTTASATTASPWPPPAATTRRPHRGLAARLARPDPSRAPALIAGRDFVFPRTSSGRPDVSPTGSPSSRSCG